MKPAPAATAVVFLLISINLSSLCQRVNAQIENISFDSKNWNMINAEVITIQGREALMGMAVLNDVLFRNGTIEVDIFATGERSYPGIMFRIKDMQNYERFYIRPHRNGLYGDDLQYTPVINGIAGWQLYNGDGYTAGIAFPDSQWIHFKFEISGDQARVYWNYESEPVLTVTNLKTGISEGAIGLFGPKDKTAYFSNFKYSVADSLTVSQLSPRVYPYGILRRWELSQPFKVRNINLEKHPDNQGISEIQWQKIESEPSGLVDIAHYTGRTTRAGDCIFARTNIECKNDRFLNLKFGYSDAISIFINGKLHFFGTSAYRQRDPSFLGIIGLYDAVYLPLKKGNNEILFTVAESFGGWGFIAQDGDAIYEDHNLSKQWELTNRLDYPESVIFDRKRDQLYVSNYFNDGQEYVSVLNLDGTIKVKEWISGLNRPTGMCISDDRLYVVDRNGLTEINMDSAKITHKFSITGASFLNDVINDADGNFYISDNDASRIYKISDGQHEIWLESGDIIKPNGLYLDGEHLLVGTSGDGCLKSIDLHSKSIKTIACIGQNSIMDGIRIDGNNSYLISDFNGRIFRINRSGEKTEILNRTAPNIFCADFEFIASKNLLIVPSLYDNRITAYTLEP